MIEMDPEKQAILLLLASISLTGKIGTTSHPYPGPI